MPRRAWFSIPALSPSMESWTRSWNKSGLPKAWFGSDGRKMRTLTVNLGERSYPIYVGEDLLGQTGEILRRAGLGKKVGVVTDAKVGELYLKPVEESLRRAGFSVTVVSLPEGEEHKK